MHRGVQLTRVAAAQGDFLLSAKLDPDRYKSVRWRTTQRLKSGSLLAISRDHFKNQVLFATVHERDANSMERNGIFVLKIATGHILCHFDIFTRISVIFRLIRKIEEGFTSHCRKVD